MKPESGRSRKLCRSPPSSSAAGRHSRIMSLLPATTFQRCASLASRVTTMQRRTLASSTSDAQTPVGQGQMDEEELAERIREGRKEMVKMGYHGPSVWVQNIAWGDHDQFKHVNNVHYIRFLESSRMLFAAKMAAKLTEQRRRDIVEGTGQSYILHSLAIRYRRPVVYPDTLLCGKKPVLPLGKDRFTLQSGIYSLTQRAFVATAEETNVNYDYRNLCKIDMPDDFRQALEYIAQNPEE